MKIVHVASEFAPWMQVGDLGDIVGGLARALARFGHEVSVFLPGYRQVLTDPRAARAEALFKHTLELGDALITAETLRLETGKNLTLYLVRRDESFDRSYPYGPPGGEYEDSDTRFVIFCKAAADALCRLDDAVDVLHCHDWPAALAPLYLRLEERKRGISAAARTVFSIYQTTFQGVFPRRAFAQTNLPEEFFATDGLEFYDQVNYLKGGILFADALLAPSPSAAREMLGPDYGFGLEGVIARRQDDLCGLLTGIEAAGNKHKADIADKTAGRQTLLNLLGAGAAPERSAIIAAQLPLARSLALGDPKEILPALGDNATLVVWGRAASPGLEPWQELVQARPGRVFLLENASPELVRQVLHGADFLLGTTRIEPSPMSAQRAMEHGVVPVMARTGGPADVVRDFAQSPEDATGLLFEPTVDGWRDGLARALTLRENQEQFFAVRRRAAAVDSSWQKLAAPYAEFYRELA